MRMPAKALSDFVIWGSLSASLMTLKPPRNGIAGRSSEKVSPLACELPVGVKGARARASEVAYGARREAVHRDDANVPGFDRSGWR
jgi:hypothetical protein